MNFHTFGNKEGSAVILIHGMLTPWQIWNRAAEEFSGTHYVIVPELDGHTENEKSTVISIEDEARKITEYIREELGSKVYLLAGLSMGGRIAAEIAKDPGLKIQNLVIDGAPLIKLNGLFKSIMKSNYRSLLNKSRSRDPRIEASFKRDFLPGEYWEPFTSIADNMDSQSIDNIIDSAFAPFEFTKYPEGMKSRFMHGTKGNESVSKKGALKMRDMNPQMEIKRFDGLAHAELACFKPQQWISEVKECIK